MTLLLNLIAVLLRAVGVLLGAIADLFGLLHLALGALLARAEEGGDWRTRLVNRVNTPNGQRRLFGVLRVWQPIWVIDQRLIGAYANAGTVLVTRRADVLEVLARERCFPVVYEPRLRRLTGGDNLALGMQESPAYEQTVRILHLVLRWEDVGRLIGPLVQTEASAIVAAAGGRLDVPAELTLPVAARLASGYLGLPLGLSGVGAAELIDWAQIMYWYVFADLGADPKVEERALIAARACRRYLEEAIAARRAAPAAADADDLLGRLLALQASGLVGHLNDQALRNHLLALLINSIAALSKAAVHALDGLLERPRQLAAAATVARGNDLEALGRYLFEALRFNPVQPVLYRRALRDCTIARGTLRARFIPQDSLVFVATLGAMFDPWQVMAPRAFHSDRPRHDYLLWGHGLHACRGRHINRAVLPLLLRPLLAALDLRRSRGRAGQIDYAGTPFPAHLRVAFGRN
ncbi:MAG: cytochrome P450 [Chromatiaceae bacterium]|nr:MAG: cytochrome P450 [Chromatiaceae bacterium]